MSVLFTSVSSMPRAPFGHGGLTSVHWVKRQVEKCSLMFPDTRFRAGWWVAVNICILAHLHSKMASILDMSQTKCYHATFKQTNRKPVAAEATHR